MSIPYLYDYVNAYNSTVSPSVIHITNTALAAYFHRTLLRKAISVFKWKLPKGWAENYFLYTLFCNGYIAIINTKPFGIIPQNCTLYGYNVMYQPNHILIANPLLSTSLDLIIDVNTTLIQLHPDYTGIMDTVYTYGDLMALTVQTLTTNLVNSKLTYLFETSNKNVQANMMQLYDKIASGEPAVFYDKDLNKMDASGKEYIPFETFTQNLSQNFISPALMETLSEIEQMFLSEIGIPSANTDKRERLINAEIKVSNIDTYSEPSHILENLKLSVKKACQMFQIPESEFSVDWRFPPNLSEKGADENGRNTFSNRTVPLG